MLQLNSRHARTFFHDNQQNQAETYQQSRQRQRQSTTPQWNENRPPHPITSRDSDHPFTSSREPFKSFQYEQQEVKNPAPFRDTQKQETRNIHSNQPESFRRQALREKQLDLQDHKYREQPCNDHSSRRTQRSSLNDYGEMGKKDYFARHQKRNEMIKNGFTRELNSDRYRGFARQNEFYLQGHGKYLEERSYRPSQKQRQHLRLPQSSQQQQYPSGQLNPYLAEQNPAISSRKQPPLSSKYDDFPQNASKKTQASTFAFTPEKKQQIQGVPGSAERKQSLIQKSQQLQLKLKKMNSSQSPSPLPNKMLSTQQFDENGSVRSVSRGRYDRLYLPSTGYERKRVQEERGAVERGGRTWKGEEMGKGGVQGGLGTRNDGEGGSSQVSVIDKISKLNEKISERIQSIITNYARK